MKKRAVRGRVIWITGLSGAGKSTLARALVRELRAKRIPSVLLDGDELRDVFGAGKRSHGRKAREQLGLAYARLARLLAQQGCTVVVATISLFRKVHSWNRAHLPRYFEVYLKVPVEELKRRDSKGIYRAHAAGKIRNVAGLDMRIEEPKKPHLTIEHVPGLGTDKVLRLALRRIAK